MVDEFSFAAFTGEENTRDLKSVNPKPGT